MSELLIAKKNDPGKTKLRASCVRTSLRSKFCQTAMSVTVQPTPTFAEDLSYWSPKTHVSVSFLASVHVVKDKCLYNRISIARDDRATKFVNVSITKGSCKKKSFCRFSHKITYAHRNDSAMRKLMVAL